MLSWSMPISVVTRVERKGNRREARSEEALDIQVDELATDSALLIHNEAGSHQAVLL